VDAEARVEAAAADREKAQQRGERGERQARDAEALLADSDRWEGGGAGAGPG
jgi:hypothetical protein